MYFVRLARDHVAKGETSREKIDRQDQVAAAAACGLLGPILFVATVWLGGREVLFAWICTAGVAASLAYFWKLSKDRKASLP